jgi:hypothetical protein
MADDVRSRIRAMSPTADLHPLGICFTLARRHPIRHRVPMSSDWKEGANADFWKDDEWRARDPVLCLRGYVAETLRFARRIKILTLRARVQADLPQSAEAIAMIDRELERNNSDPPESFLTGL